jgi:tripartite-type tricarboxylate transporter receptor subunit TctC
MMMTRRQVLSALAASCAIPAAANAQQDWPSRPLHYVAPFPPGGGADLVTRATAQGADKPLGQNIIVENRDGAGGTIGADYVARATADGYTLLMGASSTMAVNPHLYAKLPYDTRRAFAPVTLLATSPMMLGVNADLGIKSVADLIAYARKNPGKLNNGSAGNGSVGHLTSVLLSQSADIDIVHVPFRGSAPALTALVGGQIQMMIDSPTTIGAQARSGRIVALATTGEQRMAAFPDVPTLEESGLAGVKSYLWYGLFVRSGTSQEIVTRLNQAFVRSLGDPTVRQILDKQSLQPVGDTPAQFEAFWKDEFDRWGEIIRKGHVTIG